MRALLQDVGYFGRPRRNAPGFFAASVIPARRAMRLDPIVALRCDLGNRRKQ